MLRLRLLQLQIKARVFFEPFLLLLLLQVVEVNAGVLDRGGVGGRLEGGRGGEIGLRVVLRVQLLPLLSLLLSSQVSIWVVLRFPRV